MALLTITPQDAPPAANLGLVPEIATDRELAIARQWLRWLRSRQRTLDNRFRQTIELLEDGHRIDSTIRIDDDLIAIEDYIGRLERAVGQHLA
jgi:hypothetical protein